MRRSAWFLFGLFMVWAGLLLLFITIRPRLWTAWFWVLIISAFVTGAWYTWLSHTDAADSKRAWSEWDQKLRLLVDVKDVEDDGHLYEWFDRHEWEQIFSELARMPKGKRSLRQAIDTIDPGFLKREA